MKAFCYEIQHSPIYVGDILEFGTGSGDSTEKINTFLKQSRKIITFDGFKGLPKTNKVVPKNTEWQEGKFFFDEKAVREKLKQYENIVVIQSMTWDLKKPADYGIQKIAAVNMDLDLYEGTVDALKFVDQCEWTHLLIRFDDWGSYSFQIPEEVEQHEKAAFFEYIEEKKYKCVMCGQYVAWGNLQALVSISR
jgi:hypothetical protein